MVSLSPDVDLTSNVDARGGCDDGMKGGNLFKPPTQSMFSLNQLTI